MSTKNLARTVIEGGRTGWSRFSRRDDNSSVRSRTHEACARLRAGEDFADFHGILRRAPAPKPEQNRI